MATRASRIALAGSNISSTGEVDADLLDNTDSSAFLSLAADGNFFIGTSTDIAPANGTNLYVSDGTISRFGLEKTGSDARKFSINNGGTYFSVYDETADAERLRITSDGNVGIGTNSPSQTQTGSVVPKLHVKSTGTTGAYDLVARFEAGTDASTTGASILINHANDRGLLIEAGRANGGDIGVAHLGVTNSGGVNTRAITILATGSTTNNVGIGTVTPAAQMEIQTTTDIGANEIRGLLRLTGQSSAENGSGIPSAGTALEFYNRWTDGAAYSMGRISARGESSYNGGLQFDVSDNTAAGQSNFTHAVSIDPQANVGIGETAPDAKLHVRANDSGNSTIPANTVALFENNSSSIITVRHPSDGGHFSGIAMADNNIGGYVVHGDGTSGDGLHVKGYGYVQINTGASSTTDPNNHSRLAQFTTSGLTMYKPGSNTSANIWTNDNVTGMNSGGYSPKYIWTDNLQLYNWNGGLDRGWGDYPSITIQNHTTNGPQGEFRVHGIGGVSGGDFSIVMRCDGGYVSGSDSRRKTNVESVTNALSIVNQLDGKRFNIINKELEVQDEISAETTGKKFGFIAQDVQSIIPEAVKYYEDEDTPEENGYASAYSMDYASIVAVLTNAIKEQQTMIEQLQARLTAAGIE